MRKQQKLCLIVSRIFITLMIWFVFTCVTGRLATYSINLAWSPDKI